MSKLQMAATSSSDTIRRHAYQKYVSQARRRKEKTVAINVGQVHRELGLTNRIPLVCAALGSRKFLIEHGLRVVTRTGPRSGQSTTVTYTYELIDSPSLLDRQDAWNRLRGALKDVYAEYGGGEAYLRAMRASFRDADEQK
ncbi:MAG: hypothetical protein WAM78_12150 [Candidatus Sulfotelmatobacter sp.]